MASPLSWHIGRRYVTATRGKGFISFISLISVVGIALGVIALIVVLSVMNGVTSEVKEKILAMTAHAKVFSWQNNIPSDYDMSEYLADKDVLAYAPFIEGQGLISQKNGFLPVLIKGIDPTLEPTVSEALVPIQSELDNLIPNAFGMVIGKEIAYRTGTKVGDKLTLIIPKASITAAGMQPRLKRFTITGIFDSGHYTFDSSLVLINLSDARKLLQLDDGIHGYQLKLSDPLNAPTITARLNEKLGTTSLIARDWTDENKNYFDAVKAEKAAMFFILMIIIIVAAINILSVLVMVVSDKQKDIAILRTIGVPPNTIMKIFIIQGSILGIIGTIIGVIGGIVISKNVPVIMGLLEKHFGFRLPSELYFISELNPRIDADLVALIAFCTLLISVIFTIFPARKAAKTHPARALAYE